MSGIKSNKYKKEVVQIMQGFDLLYAKLRTLTESDDLEVAQLGGAYLEQVTRMGINGLYEIADKRPEVLVPWARQRLDWPAFIPEHVASKKAHVKMLDLIQQGEGSPITFKGSNLDSLTLNVVIQMFREIEGARCNYLKDIEGDGADGIPAWRHDAHQLADLDQDSKLEWFNVAWDALVHERGGEESLVHDQLILEIVGDGALLRAEGRKHKRVAKLKRELKFAGNHNTEIECFRLQEKISEVIGSGVKVTPSDIIERAKTRLKSAFTGRVKKKKST